MNDARGRARHFRDAQGAERARRREVDEPDSVGGGRARRGRGVGSVVRGVLAAALFVVGAAVYAWPVVDGWLAKREGARAVAAAFAEDAGGSEAVAGGKRAKDGDAAYQYLLAYNEQVVAGAASAFFDPWSSAEARSALAVAGLADQIIGSVFIPRLGETLPLYLGASQAHLAHGAGVADGTSAPLGQVGSNCVVAAHRGATAGMPMFRDIESMQPGDLVTIETPWDTLVYRMVESRVIASTDSDAVRPVAGRDLVTLLTCHPYGYNYQRYLVICERVATDAGAAAGSGSAATGDAKNGGLADTTGPDNGGAAADDAENGGGGDAAATDDGGAAMGGGDAAENGGLADTTGPDNGSSAATAATVDGSLLAALLRPIYSVLEPCDSWQLVLERWLRVAGLVLMLAVPLCTLASTLHRSRRR